MDEDTKDIRELDQEVLTSYITGIGEKSFRAKQVDEWIWKKNVASFDEMTTISKQLRTKLSEDFIINKAKVDQIQGSADGTIKSVFRLFDGYIVESVLIPSKDRVTACISSQVGCALKCAFCATGQMKYQRNLTVGEIFDQVMEVKRQAEQENGKTLSNIVLMGMGEPLLNYENVIKAIEIITSKRGLEFSPGRITLSTVGLTKMIKKLADDRVRFNLAVSLHVASESKRSMIMPVNKTNSLKELAGSLRYFHQKTKSRVTFEYLMLKDVNDDIKDARDLAEFCKNVPCKINIIEYNPVEELHFEKPDQKKLEDFVTFLESKNLIVNIRKSRGKDIDAACGQLAGKMKK